MMLVADSMLDNAVKQKKDSMSGQMSLFDLSARKKRKIMR